MRLRYIFFLFALSVCGVLSLRAPALAADETAREQDEQSIRAAAQEYVNALKHSDARAMHDLWVAEGDIVDEFGRAQSAHQVIDEEIEARVADATGERKSSTVSVEETSIRFLTDDVAIEDGKVEVSSGDDTPASLRGRFTALWVKQDDKWRLASLREVRVPTTAASDLAGLDWMVGRWTGRVDKATFEVVARWDAKHAFLLRDLRVTHDGKVIFRGEQRIGVDPLDGRIKSWMHDVDGGHGEGEWTKHGDDAWVVQAAGVAPDGRRTSATNLYTQEGPDEIIWKSTGGISGGHSMPEFEITLKRNAATENPESRPTDERKQ